MSSPRPSVIVLSAIGVNLRPFPNRLISVWLRFLLNRLITYILMSSLLESLFLISFCSNFVAVPKKTQNAPLKSDGFVSRSILWYLDHVFPCVVDRYIPDLLHILDFVDMLKLKSDNAFWILPESPSSLSLKKVIFDWYLALNSCSYIVINDKFLFPRHVERFHPLLWHLLSIISSTCVYVDGYICRLLYLAVPYLWFNKMHMTLRSQF